MAQVTGDDWVPLHVPQPIPRQATHLNTTVWAAHPRLGDSDWFGAQQNAYIERYNRTVRGEWLGQYIFETIEEAQEQATEWLWTYNNERPNMGIGGITPAMKLKTAA